MQPQSLYGHSSSSLQWVFSDHMYPVMKSLAKLGVIMFYFYLCDRLVALIGTANLLSYSV